MNRNYERSIDGLEELVTAVVESQNLSQSVYLWGQLCSFVENNLLAFRVLNKEIKWRPDGRYNFRTSYHESSTASVLRTSSWILRDDGAFVSSENVTRDHLSPDYEVDSDVARSLLDIIGIAEASHEEPNVPEDDSNLTETQREKIAFADKLREYGIENDEDLAEFREFRRQREAAKRAAAQSTDDSHKADSAPDTEAPEEATSAIKQVRIICGNGSVNIRVGNDTKYGRITSVKDGDTFEWVATAENGWHAIVVNAQIGWVSGKYSEMT